MVLREYLLIALSVFVFVRTSSAQSQSISGLTLEIASKIALSNVTIKEKGTSNQTKSNRNGGFELSIKGFPTVLVCSHVGYEPVEVVLSNMIVEPRIIELVPRDVVLDEVTISTGYQEIPKERATGSFEIVDSLLLNRTIGLDLLSRIKDVVPGIHFDKSLSSSPYNDIGKPANHNVYMHGISSLRGAAANAPLIVLDNFPYEGDINNINPN